MSHSPPPPPQNLSGDVDFSFHLPDDVFTYSVVFLHYKHFLPLRRISKEVKARIDGLVGKEHVEQFLRLRISPSNQKGLPYSFLRPRNLWRFLTASNQVLYLAGRLAECAKTSAHPSFQCAALSDVRSFVTDDFISEFASNCAVKKIQDGTEKLQNAVEQLDLSGMILVTDAAIRTVAMNCTRLQRLNVSHTNG